MIRTGAAAVLIAWMLVSGTAAIGQSPGADSPAVNSSSRSGTPGDPNQPTSAGAPSTRSGATGDQGQSSPSGDSDPFDYEASEQISEDLSVSFPVDI
jgi:hypothetical protein